VKRNNKKNTRIWKVAAKKHRMENAGEKSNYAKKQEFLKRNGGWGVDYKDKPWKEHGPG